jgi:hypothetical protein
VTHDTAHTWPAFTRLPFPQPCLPTPGHPSVSSFVSLSPEDTSMLIERCRSNGVTVNSVIAASTHFAVAQQLFLVDRGAATVTTCLTCCADTRRFYDPPIAPGVLGFHVSGLAPLYHKITKVYAGRCPACVAFLSLLLCACAYRMTSYRQQKTCGL